LADKSLAFLLPANLGFVNFHGSSKIKIPAFGNIGQKWGF
jgi:hypothetical protein